MCSALAARYLNYTEEDQSQFAVQNSPLHNAAREAPVNLSGTAVMARIRAGDHRAWKSWMCFETHGEHRHKREKGTKSCGLVLPNGVHYDSRQRLLLPTMRADTDLPPKSEDETLVEFVFRLLSTVEIDLGLGLNRQREPIISQGSQNDDDETKKRRSA